GKHADARASLTDREKLWQNQPAELFAVACDLARFGDRVGKTNPTPEEAETRNAYLDQAMETLRRACAAGYRNAQELRSSSLRPPLRGRADFEDLLAKYAMDV